eukprot:14740-Heterococcus_DN1.PRE.2
MQVQAASCTVYDNARVVKTTTCSQQQQAEIHYAAVTVQSVTDKMHVFGEAAEIARFSTWRLAQR